ISVVAVVVAVNPFSNAIAFQPVAVFVCLFAGTLVSAQQAFNGRVAMATGSPIAAAWMNFSVGGIMLWTLTFIRQVDFSGAPSPLEKPYLYVGGLIGATFVAIAARLVRTLGVLLLTLTSIAGQLFGAVIIDIFIPTPGRVFNGWEALGVALTFVAVIVGSGRLDRVRSRHKSA
ncbi:MAG: DMT family transporter, partial [Actinomycetes bacterium]